MSETPLVDGSHSLVALSLLQQILDALVQGEHWEGAANYRQVASGAAVSEVASSATAVELARGNRFRRQVIIYNDSSQVLYVRYGGGPEPASSTDYSFQLAAGGGLIEGEYSGPIFGVWASANGFARVTEF